MFDNLFKYKEKTSTSMTKEETLKDELWNDNGVFLFLCRNRLSTNKNDYSIDDLINIKKAIEKKRKINTEENHKKLYEVLNNKCNYIPDSEVGSNE